MKMNVPAFLVLTTIFLSITIVAPAAADKNDDELIHTIVKGDTLWDISEHYLGNPFLWPKLWQWNDYITNPHLIYPRNKVRLYPRRVKIRRHELERVAGEMLEEVEEAALEEVEEPGLSFPEMKYAGLISDEEMKGAGIIIEAEDERVLLSDGDTVYAALKTTAARGEIYTVFKVDGEVIHPVTGKSLGYKVINLGEIKIDSFSDGLAKGKIIDSFDVISRGDRVTKGRVGTTKVIEKDAELPLKGYVVAAKENQKTYGERAIVYIDLGAADGVKPGNSFYIYKEGKVVSDKESNKKYTLPPVTIGKLLVIEVKKDTSIAIIVKSVEEIHIGARIKTEAVGT